MVDYFPTNGDSRIPDACFTNWIDHYDHHFSEGPLAERAWAYQEKLLGRRFLSYEARELHWKCDKMWRCECGLGDKLSCTSDPYHLPTL
jgi:hypothetical protein